MSNCKPRYVCAGLIAMAFSWAFGRVYPSLWRAPLLVYVCFIMTVPALIVFIDYKSTFGKCLTYIINTAIALAGVFYAIYFRQPLGFVMFFCGTVGILYYFIFSERKKKDEFCKLLTIIATLFLTICLFLASANMMFNPIHSGLLNGGNVIW